MEETILLPGDVLQAKDTLDLGKFYIKSGEQMTVLGSNFNKQNELCVALSAGITNQYDPNSTKKAEIWTVYKVIEAKTKLIESKWFIDGYLIALTDYSYRLKQLNTVSLLEMMSCTCLFNCFGSNNLFAFVIGSVLLMYFIVMVLILQKAFGQIYQVIIALQEANSRKEQENAYCACTKCMKKHVLFVKYNKTIGILQLVLMLLAFAAAFFLTKT